MTAQPLDGPRGFVPRAELYAALKRVDELEAEVAYLKDELAAARNDPELALRIRAALPGLTLRQAKILTVLYEARAVVVYEALFTLVGSRPRKEYPLDPYATLKSNVCWLRQKLGSMGAPDTIQTVFGFGYVMTRFGRAWIDERIKPASAGPEEETRATDDPDAITGQSRGNR